MSNQHKSCPVCGQPMHRQSKTCWMCRTKTIAGEIETIECPMCTRHFTVRKSTKRIFCSVECYRKSMRGQPGRNTKPKTEIICLTCGKKVFKVPSELKKAKNPNFCSHECWYEYNQREKHYLWAGGQHERMNPQYRIWHKAVLERDYYLCRRCHAEKKLEVHHIYRFNTYPELRWEVGNGITLCKNCHKMVTGNEEAWEDNFFSMISLEL